MMAWLKATAGQRKFMGTNAAESELKTNLL